MFRESLAQRLLDRRDRLALVQERLDVVGSNLDDRVAREQTVATRKAELEAILAGVPETNVIRRDALTARIANLETRLTTLAAAIEHIGTRLEVLSERETRVIESIARVSARIARLNSICDAEGGPPDNMNGGESGNNVITLSFLHSDHLGRPKFATRADGSISWDGGITTPFGLQVTALAAQTQALMFPGQYEDAETTGAGVTLSHNWHRTYDPTLGRYLQSDPIGLAGGLNRYAYVGGNPVMLVDPTGEIVPLAVLGFFALRAVGGAAFNYGYQYFTNGRRTECVDLADVAINGLVSGFVPGLGTLKKFNKFKKLSKSASTRAARLSARFNKELQVSNFALSRGIGAIAKYKLDFKLGDNCECR